MSKLTTISGYVPTRPYNELDSDRYDYITLDQTEPNPGLPDSDYSLFTSQISGERRFTTDPRLSGLSFKGDTLDQLPTSNPTYFLVLKNLPGSGLVNGLDDSVAWSLGEIEEQDTLQTVTDRGNTTTQGITVGSLTTTTFADIGTNLIVGGNLTVNGTTTTLNTSELTVDDINIQIADGAPDAATADGAGITVDGAGATFTYVAATDRWTMNKDLDLDNLYLSDTLYFDGGGDNQINNASGNLLIQSGGTVIQDVAGTTDFVTIIPASSTVENAFVAGTTSVLTGEVRALDVPPTAGVVKVVFRRQSDGLLMEGEIDTANVDKVSMQPTNDDSEFYLLISEANGGTLGFDSAEFDLDLTYNPGTNTLRLQNIVATGLADLDSTNVAGDLKLTSDPSISASGRLLDSEGRSFVIYDSAGALLWGNNGTSAGNLGGAGAVQLSLNDLQDVNIISPGIGQVIKYEPISGTWLNAPDLEGGGGGGGGISLTDISVVKPNPAASGSGDVTYNNLNGQFTYTPPVIPDITNISLLDLIDVGADGTNGQVLSTDGLGNFSFINQSGGGGTNAYTTIAVAGQTSTTASTSNETLTLVGGTDITITTDAGADEITFTYTGASAGLTSRVSRNITTASLANDGSTNVDIVNGFGTYALLKIETDRAAWVRLYVDGTSRTSDASRVITDDPAPDAGVIAEVITTGAETIKMSPGVMGWLESGTDIPIRVTNLSGVTAAVQVTVTIVQLEA